MLYVGIVAPSLIVTGFVLFFKLSDIFAGKNWSLAQITPPSVSFLNNPAVARSSIVNVYVVAPVLD